MKLKQKLGVATIFALGIFVIISSSMYLSTHYSPCATELIY